MIRHLYFHIPFCPKLCPYCSFYVEVGAKNKTQQFIDALLREVESAVARYPVQPQTIYFGGGTPSALRTEQLAALLAGLRRALDLSALEEWSLEANPATIREEKARVLKEAGVTRLSLGVQSWDDGLLRVLGRVHSAAQAERTFALLRAAGFQNLNIDLMFGVPTQTLAQWEASLLRTITLQPEHVSTYCLTYEEDTDYFRRLARGELVQDVERDAEFFERTADILSEGGFHQYEISNYSRPGFESRHNQAYWRGVDYLGFGPSAYSTVGTRRWRNVADTAGYTRGILAGEPAEEAQEELTPEIRRGEVLAFGLRTREGVPLADVAPWKNELAPFHDLGLLETNHQRLRLTRRGKLMADAVAEVFV